MRNIEQAAVHRIPAGGHVVDINIAVPARLDFLCCHEKLLIQLFI